MSPMARRLYRLKWSCAWKKAFGVSMDLLLNMQVGYDAAQARMRSGRIKVKRFHPAATRV